MSNITQGLYKKSAVSNDPTRRSRTPWVKVILEIVSFKVKAAIEANAMNYEILPNLFVIGMPRSGTKLLRTLLNNHTSIYIPDIETAFIPRLIRRFGGERLNKNDVSSAVNEIRSSVFFFYYLKNNAFNFDCLTLKPGCTIYDILRVFYIELSGSSFQHYAYIGDKSPRNIHSSHILSNGFPDAKFIHIVRDPRDYALSVKKTWGKNDLRAVFRWVKGISSFQNAIVAAKRQFIEVRYEDLLADPGSTLKRCTDFLGLEYEMHMVHLSVPIEYVGDARNSIIKRDNAGKYLQEMTAPHIQRIDDYTVELLHRYGYPSTSDRLYNKRISAFMEAVLKPLDVVSMFRFNIKQHGFRDGLDKMIRASR